MYAEEINVSFALYQYRRMTDIEIWPINEKY